MLAFSGLWAQSPHGDALPINCGECHHSSGWEVELSSVSFDHDSATNFLLEGLHARVDCKACHESMIFSEVGNSCVSCHEDIHSMSVGDDCARCHSPRSWLVDEIPELHEMNGFPLIGAHTNLSCVECHLSETNQRFDRIGNECLACHFDEYQATQNPSHESAGFSTECTDCHSPLSFEWDANPISHDFFPLEQGHDIQDCNQCHQNSNFTDVSSECISCHQTDFAAAVNPPHQSLGFPLDCDACHTIDPGWKPATFDIHDQFYVLRGAHAKIANECLECHIGGDYIHTPNTCIGCHLDDFNDTDDPNHAQAGFSTDCTICHNEDAWEPSTLDHDAQFFPIFSGPHQGEWNACTDCHNVPRNYAMFTCLTCHKKNETDNEHDEVNNYVYESNACLQCHPDGEE